MKYGIRTSKMSPLIIWLSFLTKYIVHIGRDVTKKDYVMMNENFLQPQIVEGPVVAMD